MEAPAAAAPVGEEDSGYVVYMSLIDPKFSDWANYDIPRNLSCGRRENWKFPELRSPAVVHRQEKDDDDVDSAGSGRPSVRRGRSRAATAGESSRNAKVRRGAGPANKRATNRGLAETHRNVESLSIAAESSADLIGDDGKSGVLATLTPTSGKGGSLLSSGASSLLSSKSSFKSAIVLDSAAAKLSAYTFDAGFAEFVQSYLTPGEGVFRLGSIVAPTRNELKMCNALSDLGDHGSLAAFERTLYQSSVLRSRAFALCWAKFTQRVDDIIRCSVSRGAKAVLDLLNNDFVSGALLQVIVADVGVVMDDRKLVLDSLVSALESMSPREYMLIKVNIGGTIQSCLEQIYAALKARMTSARLQTGEGCSLDAAARKTVMEQIAELYRWCFKNYHVVFVVEKVTHNLNELLYILQVLKNREGFAVSCILCANCWQTNLEQHLSTRVYSGLSVLNCDVVSLKRVSDELLGVLMHDSEVQCFLPHMHALAEIWDTLYDEEMSINGLIKRVYNMYECFYRNAQFSFICAPGIVDMRSAVRTIGEAPYFEVQRNEGVVKELFCKLGLLFCGLSLSQSHAAYLQLLLDRQVSVEALCKYVLPGEAIKLIERRVALQLGIYLMQAMLPLLPDYERARSRLHLMARLLCSEHSEVRIVDMIKRLSSFVRTKQESGSEELIALFKGLGERFLALYPAVESMMRFVGHPPKYDLVRDYFDALTMDSGELKVVAFVEHALHVLMLPTVRSVSVLTHQMMLAKYRPLNPEWSTLRDLLKRKDCTGFANDLQNLVALSQTLPSRTINLWELFCLFHTKVAGEPVSKVFIRFSVALETVTQILGYYTLVGARDVQSTDADAATGASVKSRLAHMIKMRLSRFKVRRVHLGRCY
ncbi:N-acetyl-gamma-glutamyl-phosphate reductase [Babesia caballi]|uniref:N-acetyl-gamma-glutamyl-phosphate reductase n=1 Tax=Babesia caballi TaxID=5871 RepID=A0AAV4LXR0_BABCB|nr:N-acetyl-gamma-glutamyl-phosphate reductase [Babesia caballi]